LHALLARSVEGGAGTVHVMDAYLAGVDGGVFVIDAPTTAWAWLVARADRALPACCDRLGRPAERLASETEHEGLQRVAADASELAEGRVIDAWKNAGSPRLDGAIGLAVELQVCRAKDHYLSDGVSLSAKGRRFPWPTGKKPDADNALKLVMDALNARAYRDDVDVVSALVDRAWSPDGWERTIVRVRQMESADAA
jgi:Holliday junction resolvase RusA-like endonuclease